MAVWAVMVFCGLAASIGIFVANESMTWAKQASKRSISEWDFNLESVLYFEHYKKSNGQREKAQENTNPFSNSGLNPIQYWQPIEEDYGLGYIALNAEGLKNSHYCSAEIYYPNVSRSQSNPKFRNLNLEMDSKLGEQAGLQYALPIVNGSSERKCIFPFRYKNAGTSWDSMDKAQRVSLANSSAAIKRNDMYFVDHYSAAQSMGKSYDIRQYYTNGYENNVKNPGQVDLNYRETAGSVSARPYATYERRNDSNITVFEYRFYNQDFLKNLDSSLKFTRVEYRRYYHYWTFVCYKKTKWNPPVYNPPTTEGGTGWWSPGYYSCGYPYDYRYEDRIGSISSEYYNAYVNGSSTISYYCPRNDFYSNGPSASYYSTKDIESCFEGTFKKYYLTSFDQIRNISNGSITSVSPRVSLPTFSCGGRSSYPHYCSSRYSSSSNSKPYIAHDVYTQYLNSKEVPFKGVMRFDDIDGEKREGYIPLSGINRIYLSSDTRLKRVSPSIGGSWYNYYCSSAMKRSISETNSRPFCQYEWATPGEMHGNAGDDNVALWIEFFSDPNKDTPARIAYHSTSHRSGASSESKKIVYVVQDLGDHTRDESQYRAFFDTLDKFNDNYRLLYGKDYSWSDQGAWFTNKVAPSDEVLCYFEITNYSNYSPYRINNEFLGGVNLTWYTDPDLTIEAPRLMTVEDKNYIFFTRLDRLPKDFPDSCYSNNSSPVPGGS